MLFWNNDYFYICCTGLLLMCSITSFNKVKYEYFFNHCRFDCFSLLMTMFISFKQILVIFCEFYQQKQRHFSPTFVLHFNFLSSKLSEDTVTVVTLITSKLWIDLLFLCRDCSPSVSITTANCSLPWRAAEHSVAFFTQTMSTAYTERSSNFG